MFGALGRSCGRNNIDVVDAIVVDSHDGRVSKTRN